jgi:hypothetical protein
MHLEKHASLASTINSPLENDPSAEEDHNRNYINQPRKDFEYQMGAR